MGGGEENLPQGLALVPVGWSTIRSRLGDVLFSVAQVLDRDVRALAGDDAPSDAVLGGRSKVVNGMIVDFDDLVSRPQPGFPGRPAGIDPTDLGRVVIITDGSTHRED